MIVQVPSMEWYKMKKNEEKETTIWYAEQFSALTTEWNEKKNEKQAKTNKSAKRITSMDQEQVKKYMQKWCAAFIKCSFVISADLCVYIFIPCVDFVFFSLYFSRLFCSFSINLLLRIGSHRIKSLQRVLSSTRADVNVVSSSEWNHTLQQRNQNRNMNRDEWSNGKKKTHMQWNKTEYKYSTLDRCWIDKCARSHKPYVIYTMHQTFVKPMIRNLHCGGQTRIERNWRARKRIE